MPLATQLAVRSLSTVQQRGQQYRRSEEPTMISAGTPVLMAIRSRRPRNISLPSGQFSTLAWGCCSRSEGQGASRRANWTCRHQPMASMGSWKATMNVSASVGTCAGSQCQMRNISMLPCMLQSLAVVAGCCVFQRLQYSSIHWFVGACMQGLACQCSATYDACLQCVACHCSAEYDACMQYAAWHCSATYNAYTQYVVCQQQALHQGPEKSSTFWVMLPL